MLYCPKRIQLTGIVFHMGMYYFKITVKPVLTNEPKDLA